MNPIPEAKMARRRALRLAASAALVLLGACAATTDLDGAPLDAEQAGLERGARGAEVRAVNAYLTQHGYFPSAELSARYRDWIPAVAEGPSAPDLFDERTEQAVRIFQQQHGLSGTGVVDDETLELMNAPQCGNPVHAGVRGDEKWHHDDFRRYPRGSYTYRIDGALPGWTAGQLSSAVQTAFDVWSQHAGVTFTQGSGNTHAVISFVPIDGPGNTLGRTWNNYWPGGYRYSIEVDSLEAWQPTGAPSPARTLVHEIGHMLGFGHSGFPSAVMFPLASTSAGAVVLSDDDLGALTPDFRVWRQQSGLAFDVGAGAGPDDSGATWVIGTSEVVPRNFSIHRFDGQGWQQIDGAGVRIAVGREPWVVNSYGGVYRRMGVTAAQPLGTSWAEYPGIVASDIGVAKDQNPWVISTTPVAGTSNSIHRWNGSSWQQVDGGGTRIAVGDNGAVFVVNHVGAVYQRMGISSSAPTGTHWRHVSNLAPNAAGNDTGVALDVAVTRNGVAWVAGYLNGSPYTFLRNEQPASPAGGTAIALDRWLPIADDGWRATNIAAWKVSDAWFLGNSATILRRVRN